MRAGDIASSSAGREGIGRIDRGNRLEHGLEGMVRLDEPDREGDILRGHGLSVMEYGVVDELQRDGQPVR
jgi:hypothetical protein